MKPDAIMVVTTRMGESLGIGCGGTNTTNTLTPTTLRTITQLFESDECLENIKRIDDGSGFVPPTVNNANNNKISSFGNLDSKSGWHGGTTTVITPSKIIPHILDVIPEEDSSNSNMTNEDNGMDVSESTFSVVESTRPRRSGRNNNFSVSSTVCTDAIDMTPKAKKSTPKKKNASGRKPARRNSNKTDEDVSPEEEDRIKVRRLRNKEAAARCRKRRVDLTNTLLDEVKGHENKKRALEEEIQMLKGQKEELEFILQAHNAHCKLINGGQVTQQHHQQQPTRNMFVAVKSEPVPAVVMETNVLPVVVEAADAPYVIPESVMTTVSGPSPTLASASSPKRPVSLFIPSSVSSSQAGIVIETPSTIIPPSLAFDTVTSGLTPCAPPISSIITPVFTPTLNTPTCSAQHHRNSESSSSPDYVLL